VRGDVAHAPIVESFVQRARAGAPRVAPAVARLDRKQVSVVQLVAEEYRFRGVLLAQLDPLKRREPPHIAELEPAYYDLTEADMDTVVQHRLANRPRAGDAARDHQGAARDLLRHARHRVHVPEQPGGEGVDPGTSRAHSGQAQLLPGLQAPYPGAAHRGRGDWRGTCIPAMSGRSASRSKAAKC